MQNPALALSVRLLPAQFQNAFLASLCGTDFRLLRPHLSIIAVKAGDILERPGVETRRVFFPETAVLSVMVGMGEAGEPDVGLVGRDSLVGWAALLANVDPSTTSVVRVGGTMLAIDVVKLRQAAQISDSLRNMIHSSAYDFMRQMAETIRSNAWPIEGRVARWLGMVHDRTEGDSLNFTHDHIRNALQVRRASVTLALHLLEGYGALRCTRSRIIVRDRSRLDAAANGGSSGF